MSKKTVLLDCDGVLANYVEPVLDLVYERTGRGYTAADVTSFDFAKALKLAPDEARDVKAAVSDREGWWSRLPVLPGAQEGVAKLRQVAHVYIVTSPWNSCRTWLWEREAWLKKHFNLPHSNVIAGSAKHLVFGDIFVDDKTEACERWDYENGAYWRDKAGEPRESFAVQWITPHNRLDGWEGRATNSWDELIGWAAPHPPEKGEQ